jgi:hypothetical protein
VTQLIFHEIFSNQEQASLREKQLKGWRRSKKVALIEKMNPLWHDLFLPMMKAPGFNPLLPGAGETKANLVGDPSTSLLAAQD